MTSTKNSSKSHHQANGRSSEQRNDSTTERQQKLRKTNGVGTRETSSARGALGASGNGNGVKTNGISKPPHQPISNHKLQDIAAQLENTRKQLPIWKAKPDIKYALRHHDILLLLGETGSGKSTQTPQFLHNEPWCKPQKVKIQKKDSTEREAVVGGMIAITQPRRVAAITLARRVASEMGSVFSQKGHGVEGEVGYAVRFDSYTPRGTKIKFVTEGILLQEMLHDPDLKKYSAVIVDEIHERSVDVDLIAGFLRKLIHGDLKGRGGIPLKVVVMSATFDLGGYEAFFAKPEVRPDYVPGKNHGRILDPELYEYDVDPNVESPRRSSDDSFSSWDGIDSDSAETPEKRGIEDSSTKKPEINGISKLATKNPENGASRDATDEDSNRSSQNSITPNISTLSPHTPRVETQEDLIRMVSLNGVAIEKVEGRKYDVEVVNLVQPSSDYLHNILQVVLQIHIREPLPGDILCFLTGQDEIETLQTQLQSYAEKILKPYPNMKVLPLYGSMRFDAQQQVFDPLKEKHTRKVVLATNIAETSVTVPGVRFVVDCGKAKVKQYRPKLGMESLLSKPISKVSAIQRAGRAGREAKGKCYRIYTEQDFANMEMDEKPEILRCDVIEAVLKMKARGVDDVMGFPLMDSPDVGAMEKALLQLHAMGALDDQGALNDIGKKMASFPLPAAYGRVLVAAAESQNDVVLEVIDVISCLTSDTEIFIQPKSEDEQERIEENRNDITRREGDIITLLTTMQRYASENANRPEWCKKRLIADRAMKMAMKIRAQLRKQCVELKLLSELPPADPQPFEPITPERAEILIKTFLKAFGTRTALLAPDGGYLTSQGRNLIAIHPSSVLHGRKLEAIMFLENVFTAKNYAKKVSSIQANWIMEALEE